MSLLQNDNKFTVLLVGSGVLAHTVVQISGQLTNFYNPGNISGTPVFVRWFKAILSVRQTIPLFCEFILMDNGSAN